MCCFQVYVPVSEIVTHSKDSNQYASFELSSIWVFLYIAELRNILSYECILCHSCGMLSVKVVLFAVRLYVVCIFR